MSFAEPEVTHCVAEAEVLDEPSAESLVVGHEATLDVATQEVAEETAKVLVVGEAQEGVQPSSSAQSSPMPNSPSSSSAS